ncbi:hypothetical protein PIB30_048093 [Stylosanthes scabra]|uniref:Uncharacterized protein n=1 Tax=Stylosanthes scabra TaxID=79078 RepID=A0ABU6WHB7_9FABA|nr:hypothetical protein [Stylosanthes scabra]
MEKRVESSSLDPLKIVDKPAVSDAHTRGKSICDPLVYPLNLTNEARPAKSARVVVPQVPATREYSRSRADLEDTNPEDEDYNPDADVDESLEEHLDNLSEREDVGKRGKETTRKKRDLWEVHVIEDGVQRPESITSNEVFSLPPGRQVVLPFDRLLRPCGQAGGLLSLVLGSMANDFSLFPIGVRSWKQMTVYKEREFNRQIKRFFYFDDDTKESKKKVILFMLGKIWRDTRRNLFHRFYDDSKSLVKNVQK